MLVGPDVYHVGVAGAVGRGLSRIGSDGGVPGLDKEAYEYASNPNLAASLKGKLLLLHGTSDACTPVSNTMKMVDALIHAGKDFDFLILPGVGHGYRGTSSSDLATRTYAFEAIRRFFEEHLEPKRVVMVSEEPPAPK